MFSPDDKQLFSTSDKNSTIRLWDIISGVLQKSFVNPAYHVSSISFLPDMLQLATTTRGSIQIWDIFRGNLQMTIERHSHPVLTAFSPDGTQLVATSYDTIQLWDLATGSLKHDLQANGEVSSIAFSPSSRSLAAASSQYTNISFLRVWKIQVWSAATGDLQWTNEKNSKKIISLSFSPDSKWLVSGSVDTTVKVWDAGSGALHHILQSHSDIVTSVVFSPEGHLLASTSIDKTIKFWDVSSGIQTLRQHFGRPSKSASSSVFLSPDGKRLVSSSGLEWKLWDISSDK